MLHLLASVGALLVISALSLYAVEIITGLLFLAGGLICVIGFCAIVYAFIRLDVWVDPGTATEQSKKEPPIIYYPTYSPPGSPLAISPHVGCDSPWTCSMICFNYLWNSDALNRNWGKPMPWFVWERAPNGWKCATIWHVDQINIITDKRKPHLQLTPISEEEARLPIDQLREKYPLKPGKSK